MKRKALLLLVCSLVLGVASFLAGLTTKQAFIISVFSLSILGTLFFWDFRLVIMFAGCCILFLIHVMNIMQFIKFASLDVITFLAGMMIVVGMMKQSGLFHTLVTKILTYRNISGRILFIIILFFSAVLSGLTGEVTSIIVMIAVIFSISDSLEINPLPLVISSVLTTNIGSASTLLGNPIGILIALRAGLSFEDFLTKALPLSIVILAATIFLLLIWYRNYISQISTKLQTKQKDKYQLSNNFNSNEIISAVIFLVMIILIAFHKRLEILFGIADNKLLVILPVIFAGISLLFCRAKALHCIKNEVEWKSLLFFIFLFAQAGVIQSSGIAQFLAAKLIEATGNHLKVLSAATLFSSGLLSGVLDNTVVVAAFIPIVKSLHVANFSLKPLWWAMLFGACLGGNITAVGSTANIVALGLLEKQRNIKIDFKKWLKLGITIGIVSMLIAYLAISSLQIFSK